MLVAIQGPQHFMTQHAVRASAAGWLAMTNVSRLQALRLRGVQQLVA